MPTSHKPASHNPIVLNQKSIAEKKPRINTIAARDHLEPFHKKITLDEARVTAFVDLGSECFLFIKFLISAVQNPPKIIQSEQPVSMTLIEDVMVPNKGE